MKKKGEFNKSTYCGTHVKVPIGLFVTLFVTINVEVAGKLLAVIVILVDPPGGDVRPLISKVITELPLAQKLNEFTRGFAKINVSIPVKFGGSLLHTREVV